MACKTYTNTLKGVMAGMANKFDRPDVAGITGKDATEVSKILTDFAVVYERFSSPAKSFLESAYGIKKAGTMEVDSLISYMTDGAIKSTDELIEHGDPAVNSRILDKIRNYTQQIVDMSSNVRELRDANISHAYKIMLKGANWAKKVERISMGVLSGKWMPFIAESFDGLMISRDRIFKQFPVIDMMRSGSNEAFKTIETRTNNLLAGFERILDNSKAKSLGLKPDLISEFMKAYDDSSGATIDNLIKGKIDTGELPVEGDESSFINAVKSAMNEVYDQWKIFNYGIKDPDLQNYHKSWDQYQDSYNYHIIKSGVDYVERIKSGLANGTISRDFTRGLSDGLGGEIIKMFALYHFKDDAESLKKFSQDSGIAISKDNSYFLRKDYVPYLMNDSTKSLFDLRTKGGNTFADMLARRREEVKENSNGGLIKNFTTDIESYRAMMTQQHEQLFARQIKWTQHMSSDYQEWRETNPSAHDALTRFADYTMAGMKDKPHALSTTRSVELAKQIALGTVALGNSLVLMGGGMKNIIYGGVSLFSQVGTKEFLDKASGKLSLKKAKTNNDSIGDTPLKRVATIVEEIAEANVSGRRADIKLYSDGDISAMSKATQWCFDFASKSNTYGMLTPFLGFLPKSAKEAMANQKFTTNSGSEMFLRSFRKHEFFNMVSAKFSMDRALLKKTSDQAVKDEILARWSGKRLKDTVGQIFSDNKFELYSKDNNMFGDFAPDVKPLWLNTLKDATTMRQVIMGFAGVQWYTFRQAANFGLLSGLTSSAKALATGFDKGHKFGFDLSTGNVPVAVPLGILGTMIYDIYSSLFSEEEMNFPPFTALNQMQDIGHFAKAFGLVMMPLFGGQVSEKNSHQIISNLARYGGGILAGNTLQSLVDDMQQDLAPFTNMMRSISGYKYNLPMAVHEMASADNAKGYKEASNYVNGVYGVTFPVLDNILGGNNDALRLFTDIFRGAMAGGRLLTGSEEGNRDHIAREAITRFNKIFQTMSGVDVFMTKPAYNSFNKVLKDADYGMVASTFGFDKFMGSDDVDFYKAIKYTNGVSRGEDQD